MIARSRYGAGIRRNEAEVMMALVTHGDQKYQNSEKLAAASDWPGLSIEHRKF